MKLRDLSPGRFVGDRSERSDPAVMDLRMVVSEYALVIAREATARACGVPSWIPI